MKRNCQLLSFQGGALRESVKLVKIISHISPLVLYRKLHKVLVLLVRNWIFLL